MKSILVAVVALCCAVYLLNPGFGQVELINDLLPIIGNIDEATAMAVLIACARYFGLDLSTFLGRRNQGGAKGEVVDVD
ncbi:MAG: DUF1232 domain-containing protein [Verrucomicrobiae bacterium]|nr:DUF1232 domain-containing protein [Verrucomicrobiae bacterium]NNJ44094.1 DUF1232 domain-containing protein [Akkermansiaceae bacterium]